MLHALLEACSDHTEVVALLDGRMVPPSRSTGLKVIIAQPTIVQRLHAEWLLKRNVKPQDTVLCFGNLPPLFRLSGHVVVFVQNRYLIDRVALNNFKVKTKLRLWMERFWLWLRSGNAHEFVVQTPSMKAILLASGCVSGQPVHVRPFVTLADGYQRTTVRQNAPHSEAKQYDFFYAASGDPHKNHRNLVKAWCLLAQQELFPSLCLTLDESVSGDLCAWIDEQKSCYGLKLENVGFLPHEQVPLIYARTRALIYPSLFESFGLPLIEASQIGLPVLAAELDYVRDVLDPEQTFDPESPMSIARAVKRFMGLEEPSLPLMNAAQFMASIVERAE